jgi:hypothetical protein
MKQLQALFLVPLALFFTISISTFAQQPPATPQTQGWHQTQLTSGNAAVRFVLSGKFLKGPTSEVTNRPALAMDCGKGRGSGGKFVAGTLLVGAPLKIEYVEPTEIHGTSYFQKVFAQLRVDDGKVEKRTWTPGKEKTSAVFGKYTLKKILHAHTVEITVKDEGGTELVMQFDIPDSSSVAQACGEK